MILQAYTYEEKEKYIEFITQSPVFDFMQSPEWAYFKSDNWKNELIVVKDENGNIKGTMSLLIRKIPFFRSTIMYSPRGPVCDLHDYDTLRELLSRAKELSKKYKSYVLKLDTDTPRSDTEFINLARKLGFRLQDSSKNFEGIQPRFVYRLNIKGKTEEELLMSFHHKTRYNIRLAARKGVEVKVASREDIPEFYRVYRETSIRDRFVPRVMEYFERMYDCIGPGHLRIFLAYYNGRVIAGTIAILYGKKCWYLYGGSSNEHRNVMPNYLLQWEMIKWALENGCEIYDFRGVSGDMDENNPLYGLYRFKKGFNGELVELVGELDYVFNPFVYFAVEKGMKLFKAARTALYNFRRKLHPAGDDKTGSSNDSE